MVKETMARKFEPPTTAMGGISGKVILPKEKNPEKKKYNCEKCKHLTRKTREVTKRGDRKKFKNTDRN